MSMCVCMCSRNTCLKASTGKNDIKLIILIALVAMELIGMKWGTFVFICKVIFSVCVCVFM